MFDGHSGTIDFRQPQELDRESFAPILPEKKPDKYDERIRKQEKDIEKITTVFEKYDKQSLSGVKLKSKKFPRELDEVLE